MHETSSFLTLTYAEDNLPEGQNIQHTDVQKFLKRLRKNTGAELRYYMVGEYGTDNGRPHYHMCLYGMDFRNDRKEKGKSRTGHIYYTSTTLEKTWSYGLVSIQDLTKETAAYCARYLIDARNGEAASSDLVLPDGTRSARQPEYSAMSKGIGRTWFEKYKTDIFPHDYIVRGRTKTQVPKYYDKLAKKDPTIDIDTIQFNRELRAKKTAADNTDERRQVKATVALARLNRNRTPT
ncbi:MAG: hypothetical protein ACK6DA_06550 [Candidatus Kapaibacterium sp.]